jgi:hypothetical protein
VRYEDCALLQMSKSMDAQMKADVVIPLPQNYQPRGRRG